MARIGGSIMRGLAGMLGGVSDGIDDEEARRLKEAQLDLQRQAAERLQKQQELENQNAALARRVSMRDAGWQPEKDVTTPTAAMLAAPSALDAVFQSINQKRLGAGETVDGARWAAPAESKRQYDERVRDEDRAERLRSAELIAEQTREMRRQALAAQTEERKQRNSERQSSESRFARQDLTAAQVDERAANAAYNAMLRTAPKKTIDNEEDFPQLRTNFVADSTEKTDARTAAAARVQSLQEILDQMNGRGGPPPPPAGRDLSLDQAIARIRSLKLPPEVEAQRIATAKSRAGVR